MSGTVVQTAYNGQLFGSATPTFPNPTTPGNILLAFATGDNPNPSVLSDTGANSWTVLYNDFSAEGYTISYAVANGYSGTETVTFDGQGHLFTHMDGFILEISGGSVPPPYEIDTGSATTETFSAFGTTFSVAFKDSSNPTNYRTALVQFGLIVVALLGTPVGSDAQPSVAQPLFNLLQTGAWDAIFVGPTYPFSGNTGVAAVTTFSYTGTASGDVTTDSSGNFYFVLPAGTYEVTLPPSMPFLWNILCGGDAAPSTVRSYIREVSVLTNSVRFTVGAKDF